MTAVERRFLAGFRELDSGSAGLIQKDDGTIWLVNPDGSETQLPGGGGSAVQVGSGTPVGSVTPSGIGAQYLDSDTDTLYVATGVTSADWAATGGGSLPDPVTTEVHVAPTGNASDGTPMLSVVGKNDPDDWEPPLISAKDHAGSDRFTVDTLGDTLVAMATDGANTRVSSDTFGQIMEIGGSGTMGFFGTSAQAQPVVPLTTPSVQDVIDALMAIGLVAQHD